jgi:hypothetical protein
MLLKILKYNTKQNNVGLGLVGYIIGAGRGDDGSPQNTTITRTESALPKSAPQVCSQIK